MATGNYILAFSEMLWPDSKRGPWYVRANWVEVGGQPECAGLIIWKGAAQDAQDILRYRTLAGAAPEPIAAADLRSLPIGQIVSELRDRAARHEAAYRDKVTEAIESGALRVADEAMREGLIGKPSEWGARRRGRPRLYDDEHFADVALVYMEAWGRGEQPTRAVAEHFGVSRSAAAKWVARARQLELLGPARLGRAGVTSKPATKTIRRQTKRKKR